MTKAGNGWRQTAGRKGGLKRRRMARERRVVDAKGRDSYFSDLERLRRPITLLSGSENLVWTPESTERTYRLLGDNFGEDLIRRVVFEDYGHQDVFIGAETARDVFPTILEHLERVNA